MQLVSGYVMDPLNWLCLREKMVAGTAARSSILAWRLPRAEQPGSLWSGLGLQRVRHHGSDLVHNREKWIPMEISNWKEDREI